MLTRICHTTPRHATARHATPHLQEVLEIVLDNPDALDSINVTAALQRIAKVGAGGCWRGWWVLALRNHASVAGDVVWLRHPANLLCTAASLCSWWCATSESAPAAWG
jgi:hypothetical protein